MNDVTVTGQWYFWFPCKTCKQLIPYMECTPDAIVGGDLEFEIGAVPCEHCGAIHRYRLRDVVRAQVGEAPPPSTVQ